MWQTSLPMEIHVCFFGTNIVKMHTTSNVLVELEEQFTTIVLLEILI